VLRKFFSETIISLLIEHEYLNFARGSLKKTSI